MRARQYGNCDLRWALLPLALGACTDAGPPVASPYPDSRPSRIVEDDAPPLVEHLTPRDSLHVYELHQYAELTLVFFQGRGIATDGSGIAYVPDADASRVLAVDRSLQVVRTIGGPSDEAGRVGLPLSAAPTPDGAVFVTDVEHPDGLLYFAPDGDFMGSSRPPVLNGQLRSGPGSALWAARSPYIFGFEPTPAGEPLLFRFDPLAGVGVGVAEIEPLEDPSWNRLANAGSLAVDQTGTAFFAFLLHNEVRAYGNAGELIWRVRRTLSFDTPRPAASLVNDQVQLRMRPVTQALALGPDGLLYALTASDRPADGADVSDAPDATDSPAGHRRVEVYDPTSGQLIRATTIPAKWNTFGVDDEGRLYRLDPEAILATAPPAERRPLPDVPLVSFAGDSSYFADHRGKALLVNFWASWCVPCRKELPQLAAYYETLDHERVEFLAISDDENESAARRFADALDLPFPQFFGEGHMAERFGYVALPYTLIVDYRGRIVEEFYGFGGAESWRRLTSALEREMSHAVPADSVAQPAHEGGRHVAHAGGEDANATADEGHGDDSRETHKAHDH